MVIFVLAPSAATAGGSARLSASFRPTVPGPPIQYRGRHSKNSKSLIFVWVAYEALTSGSMKLGGTPWVAAKVTVPPRCTFPPAAGLLPAEFEGLKQAAISTQATVTAATAPRFLTAAINRATAFAPLPDSRLPLAQLGTQTVPVRPARRSTRNTLITPWRGVERHVPADVKA